MTKYNALIHIKTSDLDTVSKYRRLKLGEDEYLILYQDEAFPAADPVSRFLKRNYIDSLFTTWLSYCLLYEAQTIEQLVTAVDTYGLSWFRQDKPKTLKFLNGVNTNE